MMPRSLSQLRQRRLAPGQGASGLVRLAGILRCESALALEFVPEFPAVLIRLASLAPVL